MFTQRVSLTNQDARKVSDAQLHELGTVAETADGRVYRYSQAGATALAAGKVNSPVAKVANHTNIAVAADASVGDRKVTVTLGATAATQDQYKDGFLVVNDGAGVGCAYRIAGNTAGASAGTVDVYLADSVEIDLAAATSKVSLAPNPWAGSVVTASSNALFCNGSNNVAVAAGSFYWSQTRGTASVLSDGIIAKGAEAIVSGSVAGALATQVDTDVVRIVGVAPEATVDAKYYPVFLLVD